MNTLLFKPIFERNIEDLVDSFFGFNPTIYNSNQNQLGKVNIKKTDDGYDLDFYVPGFTKDDISVEVNDGNLTVSATVEEKNDDNYRRKEFYKKSFSRSFTLSDDIDQDSISGSCKDGILSLKLKKIVKPELKPKKIELN